MCFVCCMSTCNPHFLLPFLFIPTLERNVLLKVERTNGKEYSSTFPPFLSTPSSPPLRCVFAMKKCNTPKIYSDSQPPEDILSFLFFKTKCTFRNHRRYCETLKKKSREKSFLFLGSFSVQKKLFCLFFFFSGIILLLTVSVDNKRFFVHFKLLHFCSELYFFFHFFHSFNSHSLLNFPLSWKNTL